MATQASHVKAELPATRLSRKRIVGAISEDWPNKASIIVDLADWADSHSRGWPPMSRMALFGFLAGFGAAAERAKNPEECAEAYFSLLKHLACPEPGWEGAEVIIED